MTPTQGLETAAAASAAEVDDIVVGPALLQGVVRLADPRWSALSAAGLTDLVLSAVAGSSVAPVCVASCDVLFTDDAEMAELNGRFRMVRKPTNVLAFPSGETCERGVPSFLGGIALSFERVAVEADARAISPTAHATHLTLHGLLHLIGYDHERDEDREAMERVEIHILAGLGIHNPYEGAEEARL